MPPCLVATYIQLTPVEEAQCCKDQTKQKRVKPINRGTFQSHLKELKVFTLGRWLAVRSSQVHRRRQFIANSMLLSVSKRPPRRRAGSMASGLLVAVGTMTGLPLFSLLFRVKHLCVWLKPEHVRSYRDGLIACVRRSFMLKSSVVSMVP